MREDEDAQKGGRQEMEEFGGKKGCEKMKML